jgi:hypothetical protein
MGSWLAEESCLSISFAQLSQKSSGLGNACVPPVLFVMILSFLSGWLMKTVEHGRYRTERGKGCQGVG